MAADKRIFSSPSQAWKGGMDKDTHERFVQNGFYRDARNVSFMVDGDRFILKNIKGDTQLPYTLNTGESMVVGAYDDHSNRVAYVLVWNSLGNHEVLKVNYDVSALNVTQITEGEGLGFQFNNLITGIELVLGRFLYWVDDLTECIALDLENVPATITSANRYLIEAAKAPNPKPAEVRIGTDVTRENNNLTKKIYKFRTRYRIEGGYRTAASTISKISTFQYEHLQYTDEDEVYFDNVLYISIPTVDYENVTGIEILIQYGNSDDAMSDWYLFKEIDPQYLPQSVAFTGAEYLTAIDNVEVNEAYSFVPPTAKDVVLLPSNVIAWANITDNLDASNVEPKVNFELDTITRPTSAGAAGSTLSYTNLNTPIVGSFKSENFNIKIDSATYDTLTFGTVNEGDVITIELNLQYSGSGIFTTPKTRAVQFQFLIEEQDIYGIKGSGSDVQVVNRKFYEYMSTIDTTYDGYGGIVFYWDTNLYTEPDFIYLIQGENVANSQYGVTTTVTSMTVVSIAQNFPTGSFSNIVSGTRKTFKQNATHSFAVQYEDQKGRRTSAIPLGEVFVPHMTTYDEYPVIKTLLNHLAPANATRYHLLYGGNKEYDEFLQLWVRSQADRSYIDIKINEFTQRVYIDEAASTSSADIAQHIVNELNSNESISFILTASLPSVGATTVILTGNQNKIRFYNEIIIPENSLNTADVSMTTYPTTSTPQTSTITNISGSNVTTDPNTNKEVWYFDVYRRIEEHLKKYPDSPMEYNFVKGDRVRIIAKYDSVAPSYLTSVVDVPITSDDAYGVFINENLSTSPFSFSTNQNLLIEFYRPKTGDSNIIYNEIGVSGEVSSEGYHLAPKYGIDTAQTSSTPAEINLISSGDVYYKFRATSYAQPSSAEFVEDQNISDFMPSKVTDLGRISVVDELALKSVRRGTAIVYSQPIVNNTDINGLAIVLGSSIKEYDIKYGTIQKMFMRMDRELVLFFEDKVGVVGILSELVRQPNGDLSYATDALLNNLNVYNYDGGIGTNPESFSRFENTCYFVSQKNNAVCRLQPQTAITEVSQYGMKSWFNDNLDVKTNFLEDSKFIGGYDERNGCYVLSLYGYIKADSVTGDATNPFVTFTKNNAFASDLDLNSKTEMLILSDGTDKYVQRGVLINVQNNNSAQISYGAGVPIGDVFPEAWLRYRIDTLWFNEEANAWMSFLDKDPEYMTTCGVDMLSFIDGEVWISNSDTRNSLLGTNVQSTVDVVFNVESSRMKLFQNLEQEASSPWKSNVDGDILTLSGQTSLLEEAFYTEYQPQEWSAAFRQDTSTPNRTYPLVEGYDLRDRVITVKLRKDGNTEESLESVTLQYYPSESSQ